MCEYVRYFGIKMLSFCGDVVVVGVINMSCTQYQFKTSFFQLKFVHPVDRKYTDKSIKYVFWQKKS